MNIGYNIGEHDQDLLAGIPLTISRRPSKFYLGFFMHLQADDARKYMMVTQSMTLLTLSADLSRELLHYDYQRDKHLEEGYPQAYLHICAGSTDWEIAGRRPGNDDLPLPKMHLPVGPGGGRRFRPSVEDVIEFVIVEGLVQHRDGWKEALDKTRQPFRAIQLKAAIRENQQLAKDALEQEGWKVTRSKP